MNTYQVIVMGVSGCGKSTVGEQLARRLGYPYHDGDDYHPPENIAKMQSGQPLNDADRAGWLATLNQRLRAEKNGVVLACSALKAAYREQLAQGLDTPIFVYLHGDFDTIWARHQHRQNHYFNGQAMLQSQFDTLQVPTGDNVITVDVRLSVDDVVAYVVNALAGR